MSTEKGLSTRTGHAEPTGQMDGDTDMHYEELDKVKTKKSCRPQLTHKQEEEIRKAAWKAKEESKNMHILETRNRIIKSKAFAQMMADKIPDKQPVPPTQPVHTDKAATNEDQVMNF